MTQTITWQRSDIRWFNGCVQTCIVGQVELGLFREKHAPTCQKWALRQRPVDATGKALDSWGGVLAPFETKRELLEYAKEHIGKLQAKEGE